MRLEDSSAAFSAPLVRCLSFHADYGCQNSGVCCSSGWEIAVETRVEIGLWPRLQSGALRLPNGPDGFRPVRDPPSGCKSAFRVAPASGSCWFRDEDARLCAIHRELGEPALPSACRQFPRMCVLEPGTVSVSLSHYCPTAAALLFREDAGLALVESPRGFPASWPFEGLDSREAHPPFLRPGVLLGFDGLRAFEEGAVSVLAEGDVWRALGRIDVAAAALRRWTPAAGALTDLVRTSFADPRSTSSRSQASDPSKVLMASLAKGAPDDPSLPAFRAEGIDIPAEADLPLRRYLAARLIAGWIMYQADDVAAAARYLRLCLNTVLLFAAAPGEIGSGTLPWKEAIRNSDLWILHHCDPELLALNLG